ncbi:MAG: ribose transport system substrate-binding protein [Solirubrobacteraceae bacterium]|jgi:ribose transport system substrate-binding protein|nr:ribose transport system substrate-binding protein [Solirubrobacteraceae bacterium]
MPVSTRKTNQKEESTMLRRFRPLCLLAAAALSAGALAACGSDDAADTGTSTSAGETAAAKLPGAYEQPLGGEAQARAVAEGEKLGTSLGKTELKPRTLGILHTSAASPAAAGLQKATQQAAEALGWKTVVCDGQGINAQIRRCLDNLLSQKVDGVADIAVDASIIGDGLRRAKKQGVPVVAYGGLVPKDPLFPAQYAPGDAQMAELGAKWLVDKLGGEGKVFMNVFKAGQWSELREEAATKAFESTPGIEIIGKHSIDYAKFNQDIRQATSAAITANPDVKGFFGTVDFVPQPVAQAIQQQSVSFDDVESVAFYATDLNMSLLRQGQLDAVAHAALNAAGWILVDQFAEFFARDREFQVGSTFLGAQPDELPLDFMKPFMVTKEDLPAKGAPVPPEDYVSFFMAKWAKEFGTKAPPA